MEDVLLEHAIPVPYGGPATYLDALEALRELMDVSDWQEVASVAAVFQQTACLLRAAEYVNDGMATKDARDRAAIEFDLSWDTVRARAKRWSKDSRRRLP